jgi:hypothetical protein
MIMNLQLRGFGVALPADRVTSRGGSRSAIRPDEDAVTLAATAAAAALVGNDRSIGALLFATITPPYREGGSVQPLAELLGLQGDLFALDLNATVRDGLAALRIAEGLAASGTTTLVIGAHADPADGTTGDGAVALLVGPPPDLGGALATVRPVASSAIELRDRWWLTAGTGRQEADRSFVEEIGTVKVFDDLLESLPVDDRISVLVTGPDQRGARTAERKHGSDGTEPIISHVGMLGSAHALLRLIVGLDERRLSVATSNGLAEAVIVDPTPEGTRRGAEVLAAVQRAGNVVATPMASSVVEGFDPFVSGPRSWRDRDQDYRLAGVIGPKGEVPIPTLEPPLGTVIARTVDRVYPGARSTEMIAIRTDNGGQFYGQVAAGETVQIGDRAQLVPRVLHAGGDVVHYFWKAVPCP